MGLRRWLAVLALVALPLAGFGAVASNLPGPYAVDCKTTEPHGFKVIITSLARDTSTTILLPVGGCP